MTLSELLEAWRERDRRYSLRNRSLSDSEAEQVRAWRRGEIDALSALDRNAAWRDLIRWIPPVPMRRR